MGTPLQLSDSIVERALRGFVDQLVAALPRIAAGLLFLALALVALKFAVAGVRVVLARTLPDSAPVYRQFVSTIVTAFLAFGIVLSFLSIVGLEGIAVSLGTASGFLALGVAYALSNMIADAVAGVYLLRDPDFNPGDEVVVDDVTGTVLRIELRKTRFDVDGDTVVRGNATIEPEWRRRSG